VPRAELACGRAGDDGDVMVAQPVRPALRPLSGRAACMAASCCICVAWGTVPPRTSVEALALCVWAHAPAGAGLLMRGGDLSCETETCRGGPSSGELVRDAANWPETGHLASVGLDQGLPSSLS
jgi:hypothetical protein